MRGSLRTLAALLALFALSAYYAEGVMASWCMPGTNASASADAISPTGHAGTHHGDAPSSDPSESGAPACPGGMTGAGASCVAASLPGTVATVRAAPISEAPLLLDAARSPDLLLISAHFRPPRA